MLPIVLAVAGHFAARHMVLSHATLRYVATADAASRVVNEEISRGETGQVYSNADDAFRASASPDSAVERFERIRRRLGDCHYAGPVAWSVREAAEGAFVVTTYRGRCANGESTETLKWHIVGGNARLAAWQVKVRPTPSGVHDW